MKYSHNWEEQIRMEASSQSIEVTIRGMEARIGVKFPRGSSPTKSREIMYDRIEEILLYLAQRSG